MSRSAYEGGQAEPPGFGDDHAFDLADWTIAAGHGERPLDRGRP